MNQKMDEPYKCKDCKKELNESATKCDKCGSFQNKYRRGINLFSSTIGLCIAIASLITIAIQLTALVAQGKNQSSKLQFAVLESNGSSTFETFVTNTGNGPAAIYGGWVAQYDKNSKKKIPDKEKMHFVVPDLPIVIEPKKSMQITFFYYNNDKSLQVPNYKYDSDGKCYWKAELNAINAQAEFDNSATLGFYADFWPKKSESK